MSTLYVEYAGLECAAEGMTNLAEQLTTYANNLTNRISNQFSEVEGGSSDYLNSASYFIGEKIESLTNKADQFSGYAKKITAFAEVARRADQAVADFIQTGYDTFTDQKEIDQPAWKETMVSWMCWLRENSILFDGICSMIETIGDKTRDLLGELRYWYQCEGGKQRLEKWLAIGGVIVGVLLLLAALPALATISGVMSGIFALAGVVGSIIGLLDAVANLVTSIKAEKAFKNGDMAWAKIYGDQNKLTDTIRAKNFGSAGKNQAMGWLAIGIDFADGVCAVVGAVEGLTKLKSKVKFIDNYISESSGLKRYLGIIEVDDKGKEKITYTFKSVKDGLWKFIKDLPADSESGMGLRSKLNSEYVANRGDAARSMNWEGFKGRVRYGWKEGRLTNMLKHGPLDAAEQAKKAGAMDSFRGDYAFSKGFVQSLFSKDTTVRLAAFAELKKMKNYANIVKGVDKTVEHAGQFIGGDRNFGDTAVDFVKGNTLPGKIYSAGKNIYKGQDRAVKAVTEAFQPSKYGLPNVPEFSAENLMSTLPFNKVTDMPSIEQMKFEASSIPRTPVIQAIPRMYPAA